MFFADKLFRLYLAWLLTAISSTAVVLALVALSLDLDDLFEGSEHALLFLLPVTGYHLGRAVEA